MCPHFHIKGVTCCYLDLCCCSALIGCVCRASISRDPFYDMLATRKRRIASKKWRQSAPPASIPASVRNASAWGGRDVPLRERRTPPPVSKSILPLQSTTAVFRAHMCACRVWRVCVCVCWRVHANVAPAVAARRAYERRRLDVGRMRPASPVLLPQNSSCVQPQDGTWAGSSQLGWFPTFLVSLLIF